MSEEKPVVEFGKRELDPEVEAQYRAKISQARRGVDALKGTTPVGGVPRPSMPNFRALQEEAQASRSMERALRDQDDKPKGVEPRAAGSGLREETARQLEGFAKAQDESAKKQEVKDEKEEKKEEQDLFELFNFNSQNEAERILNNKRRKLEIEGRCQPMDFEDLLIRDEVQQIVPIQPGKFEPRFRSTTPEESLFIKRFLQRDQGASDQFMLEKFNLCLLCCSLVSINGKPLPDHRGKDGSPDDRLFEDKLRRLTKMSGYIVADLGINYVWFDLRVRKLINPDDLKNG